ncbi:Lrp/AsnC family transcriptional regulator [Stenotrophomonas sp. Sa5BUN4]|jgi:Lrp/AsnC family leucine-responsive transcriptional regulator|uniref:Lrp/AsnC family transcriptional regulator n=1 Tax=Stenotrophomonas lacuserhaii TaxID=2760084 RepID=A0A8X8FUX1_9GAMM|nr:MULTISPECIES: Lrp/AsnC family transcriptional regulator [Stenotrophomonas]KIP87656.1 AsnC family transcriptional regulator [Stenotrophomonas maltophilia]MBD7953322.1 Lrp/AsnC family transcriptional regulator [Stenotrophomonas pennii]MBD8644825.1 Lrp/AsnC family transcriptional regulator [Stenotrophomonas sp. CFBP 13724]MDY1034728.1 Lrp/AsnC family transcriptional regulator [Stenotrophomonas sp. CFBP8980]PKH71069.1 Lrp/AsnC family transcriptional regulator [Stenotrophomonas sp. Betaine-02u-2
MAGEVQFDRTDLRLLAEIQRDGRATNAELATRVNLSPSACLRRLQRLEGEGVIAGYGARLEPKHIGLGLQAFVRVQLEKHDQAAIARFADSVVEWDEVVACHALTGDMDYLLQIYVRDLEHFSSFLLDKLLNASGVADVNSSFVLRTVKPFRALPLSQLGG